MDTDDIDIKQCENCNAEITDGDYLSVDEKVYCLECSAICCECQEAFDRDDLAVDYQGDFLCIDCRFYCDYCSEYFSGDSYNVNGETWCQADYENSSWHCNRCEENYPERYTSYGIGDETYCVDCYERIGAYCEDCDSYYYAEEGCPDCEGGSTRTSCCGTRHPIHNYGCKPPVQFIGSDKHNLFMGIELETEIHDSDIMPSAQFASQQLAGIAILKSDSSIGRNSPYSGYEIVSQPHSHLAFRENSQVLWDTIDRLRKDYSARSWDTESCGLHIHVSRAGFNGGAHMHRFIAFIYHNSEQLMKFAGRKSDFARFNDVYKFDEYDKPIMSFAHKLDRRQHSERYSAVNTQNKDTLELRFFRGTVNVKGVLSCIDLTHAIAEYTRNLRVSDVRLGALRWDWFTDFVEANNGIYPDLYDRLPKIATVNINKPEKANA